MPPEMLVTRAAIRAPVLPSEIVGDADIIEAIGGAVEVRALLLGARVEMFRQAQESQEKSLTPWPLVLAATVFAEDGAAVYSVEGWEVFETTHFAAAQKLFAVAQRLNGLDLESEKKS